MCLQCFRAAIGQQFISSADVCHELLDISAVDGCLIDETLAIGYEVGYTLSNSLVTKIVQLEVEDDTLTHICPFEHDAHFCLAATGLEHDLSQSAPPTRIGQRLAKELIAHLGIDVGSLDRVSLFASMANPNAVIAELVLTFRQVDQLLVNAVVSKGSTRP